MTYIVTVSRVSPDNIDFAVWRCLRQLDRHPEITKWRVESPKGETLAEGAR